MQVSGRVAARSDQPAASLLIVNYRSADYIRDLLSAISEPPPSSPVEVIIIDNSAFLEIPDFGCGYPFPVRVIGSARNLGYAAACNRGLAEARGRVIVFCNPDVSMQARQLERLIDFIDHTANAGAVSPDVRLYHRESPFLVSSLALPDVPVLLADNTFLGRFMGFQRRFMPFWASDWRLRTSQASAVCVQGVIGAILAIRRDLLVRLGGMDDRFFAAYEDVDLCRRLAAAGYCNYILKDTVAVHFHCQVRRRAMDDPHARRFIASEHRMPARYIGKHYGLPARLLFEGAVLVTRCRSTVAAIARRTSAPSPVSAAPSRIHLRLGEDLASGQYLLEISHSRSFLYKMSCLTSAGSFFIEAGIVSRMLPRPCFWRAFRLGEKGEMVSDLPTASGMFVPS